VTGDEPGPVRWRGRGGGLSSPGQPRVSRRGRGDAYKCFEIL